MLNTLNMFAMLKMPAMAGLLGQTDGIWLPPPRSTVSPGIDFVWNFIFWIMAIFFVLITVLVILFSWKYRHIPGKAEEDAPKHNNALELTWTFIPTVLVAMIFYYGFTEFVKLAVMPPNAYQVDVLAHMWSYSFQYPNGYVDENLHIPGDRPVVFVLHSSDVIHGFFIPQFRVKKDIVPARYNKIWAQAQDFQNDSFDEKDPKAGYDIYCTQYCGQGHSVMRAKVFVHATAEDFDKWLDGATNPVGLPPWQKGERLYKAQGCISCHSTDGTKGNGPTWRNIFGYTVKLADGREMLVDELYVRTVITKPNIYPLPDFKPAMPTFGLSDTQIDNLIAFIKHLSDKAPPETLTTAPSTMSATAPAGALPVR